MLQLLPGTSGDQGLESGSSHRMIMYTLLVECLSNTENILLMVLNAPRSYITFLMTVLFIIPVVLGLIFPVISHRRSHITSGLFCRMTFVSVQRI